MCNVYNYKITSSAREFVRAEFVSRVNPLFNRLQKKEEVLNSTVFFLFFYVCCLISPVFIDRFEKKIAFKRVEFLIGPIEIW